MTTARRCGAVTTEVNTGRREHVGARAQLIAIADSCVEVVGRLDGLVRVRFRNDAEKLAAWESARNVDGPFRGRQGSVSEEVPGDPSGAAPAPAVIEGAPGTTGAAPAPAPATEVRPQAEAA